ncbi:DUF4340 domain-containing protein [bacterium]|nr:DUF4340 domain-containing protein [bacterium]
MASKQASKRNLALLGILAALVLVALFAADPFGWFKPSDKDTAAKDPAQLTLVDADAESISSLEIKPTEGEPFTITREQEEWWVVRGDKRFRANMDRVTPMLDQLPGARSETVATSNAEKYEELEVTPEKAIGLKIFAGGKEPVANLLVGKAAEGFKACFVRTVGAEGESKEVYRAGVNIKQLVSFAFDDYRTMKPWTFDPALATEIRLRRPPVQASAPPAAEGQAAEKPKDAAGFTVESWPAESLVITKSGEFWQIEGRNANQNMVKDMLQKFSELQVNEYLDNPAAADTGFAADAGPAIEVTTPGGKYSLTLGPEKTSSRAAKDSAGIIYRISTAFLRFYLEELKWDELKFDDTAKEEEEAAGAEAGSADEADTPAEGESAAADDAAAKDAADGGE